LWETSTNPKKQIQNQQQLYSLHNSPISTSCGVHNNRCPSFCPANYQLNICDQFLFFITFSHIRHIPPSGDDQNLSIHILFDKWLVCYLKIYLLNINFIHKVILSLGLLSHSNPSFRGIRIVRKFY